MDEFTKIIETKFKKIISDLDKVGAKKASRDTVEKNLDELKTELVNHFETEADNMKNRLVISKLQALIDEFRQMSGQ